MTTGATMGVVRRKTTPKLSKRLARAPSVRIRVSKGGVEIRTKAGRAGPLPGPNKLYTKGG